MAVQILDIDPALKSATPHTQIVQLYLSVMRATCAIYSVTWLRVTYWSNNFSGTVKVGLVLFSIVITSSSARNFVLFWRKKWGTVIIEWVLEGLNH